MRVLIAALHGASVAFTSVAAPGAPQFRLTYAVRPHDALAVTFEMKPPGQLAYHVIAATPQRRT